ncbi:hypothetical protein KAH94_05980 [bacterium]|nr:hypothetical protein [bacterium]
MVKIDLGRESLRIKKLRDETKKKLNQRDKIILAAAKAEADSEQQTLID